MRICLESDNLNDEFENFISFRDRICKRYIVSRDEDNDFYNRNNIDILADFFCRFDSRISHRTIFTFTPDNEISIFDILTFSDDTTLIFDQKILDQEDYENLKSQYLCFDFVIFFKRDFLPKIFAYAAHNEEICNEIIPRLTIMPIDAFAKFWAKDRANAFAQAFCEPQIAPEIAQKIYEKLLISFDSELNSEFEYE